MFIETMLFDI